MQLKRLDSYEREYLSQHSHTVLCNFASGDLSRPIRNTEVDWEEIFQGVGRNGLLGLTYRYLQQGHSKHLVPHYFKQWVGRAFRTHAIRVTAMYRKVASLLTKLTDASIDYMVIKGPALANLVYPDPVLRGFNDLDILIRERDWNAMHTYLLSLGYLPEHDWPYPPPKLVDKEVIYELKYWHPKQKLLVEVHYDDLLNAGLASRDFEGFWRRAITVDVDGVIVKTLSLEDQLIHLSMHAHYHGYTRLNWFSDIGLLLQRYGQQLDWRQMLRTVQIEEAHVGVYYSLYFLDLLFGISVPTHVLHRLRPDRFRRWWHEYYLPAESVLSLEPMYRPDFSFYFQPLLKRMLPDLLVMGRRREKFHYLAHLLTPPDSWLQNYYQLDNSASIKLHYLLHPLKLMYHYAYEIAKGGNIKKRKVSNFENNGVKG